MHRCSRFEWFLEDALYDELSATGRKFKLRPQYPVMDHRGFEWFWDLGVWVDGSSYHGGSGLLIDVNGPNHLVQKTYSGPGGGYTRDYDKVWELKTQRWHKHGWDHWIVQNDQCRRSGGSVYKTAAAISKHIVHMADTFL